MTRNIMRCLAILFATSILFSVPATTQATCDPAGTKVFRSATPVANQYALNGDGTYIECGPPPEQNWCDFGLYPPPPCCNGYHIETDPYSDSSCFYCVFDYYVCD
jgi:hypothetical protein